MTGAEELGHSLYEAFAWGRLRKGRPAGGAGNSLPVCAAQEGSILGMSLLPSAGFDPTSFVRYDPEHSMAVPE